MRRPRGSFNRAGRIRENRPGPDPSRPSAPAPGGDTAGPQGGRKQDRTRLGDGLDDLDGVDWGPEPADVLGGNCRYVDTVQVVDGEVHVVPRLTRRVGHGGLVDQTERSVELLVIEEPERLGADGVVAISAAVG